MFSRKNIPKLQNKLYKFLWSLPLKVLSDFMRNHNKIISSAKSGMTKMIWKIGSFSLPIFTFSFLQNYHTGFRSRSREPAIKIDGSETLRHPVYIIARVNESIYFLITLGTLVKSLFTNLLYIWALGAGSRRLRNPIITSIFSCQSL